MPCERVFTTARTKNACESVRGIGKLGRRASRRVHEVTSRQLFDFPTFPGKALLQNNTIGRIGGKKKILRPQKKKPSGCLLLTELLQFGAATYHLADLAAHPSPSASHNSRNTLNKSESGGVVVVVWGGQDKYCVSISPPSPLHPPPPQLPSNCL